jgi:hypothetical protein
MVLSLSVILFRDTSVYIIQSLRIHASQISNLQGINKFRILSVRQIEPPMKISICLCMRAVERQLTPDSPS